MKLTIVYDNETTRDDLIPAWGFASIIETKEKTILFDTGWDGSILLSNMRALGYEPKDLDTIILSHWHWDHLGGLPTMLAKTRNIEVIVPGSFSKHLKNEIERDHKIRSVSDTMELFTDIWSTGELEGRFQDITIGEQSLLLKTSKGLMVLTGCSHPGLEMILKKASDIGSVFGVVGGFHGFDKYDALKDIELIVPTHCTQNKKEIKDIFKSKVVDGGVGWSITI